MGPARPASSESNGRYGLQELIRTAEAGGLRVGLANTVFGRDGLNSVSTAVRPLGSDVEFRALVIPLSAEASAVLDLRLTNGRWAASEPALGEAVVNETLARHIWPDGGAVGRTINLVFNRRSYTIVGVTRDAHLTGMHDPETDPLVHIAPSLDSLAVLLARTEPGLESTVRAVVASVAPDVGVRVTPLRESMRGMLEEAALGAAIAAVLGAVAVLLASVGVFSVFAYLVEARRREIGIRLALGASRRQIGAALVHATSAPAIAGVVAGLGLSAMAGAALRRFLFGLSPADPVSYAAVAVVLVVAALLATAVPIRRALRVDPAVTLKAD